ncbi:uncharacterized protein [Parasteatoda tepidariorum]|uniref:uncharacterized protein isoform X2 n=1 Tax=Parasteatoda tepidariorum TaxID=114398 RepID=UPI00077F894D|nr:protein arginine N-methyltransferase 1 isoform X2 [Parasteatoda tepidariorum]
MESVISHSETAIENNNDSTLKDAEDGSYSGSDEDDELQYVGEEEVTFSAPTLCLFCSEVFNQIELMFEHCRSQHMFDIVGFSRSVEMNCITYIKFINYIRAHRMSSSEMRSVNKENCPWNNDEYMKPFNISDPLLTFDFESYLQEKLAERKFKDEMITIPQSRFEAILDELSQNKIRLKIANERIDRMKETAKTVLLCNNQQCSYVNNINKPSSIYDTKPYNQDEDYYFSTYDHFAIHHEMLQDKVRTVSYQEAILNNPDVFKGKRVLDVGCGTSILSMFAAKAGAVHVEGVDKSEVIFQAIDIVNENGYNDVINLFKGRVEDMPMPQGGKVDVIISEWMGYFLLFEGMLDSVIYARNKFLAPGGAMFPDRATISILAVSDLAKYKEYVNFWDDVYGFKMSAMKKDVIKEANVEEVKQEYACSEPAVVKELDLTQCEVSDTDFSSTFELKMARECKVTALLGYFDCFFEKGLTHKVVLSTSPKAPTTHWKQTMFLLPCPVYVIEGEVVPCKISCRKNRRDPRSIIVKLDFGKHHNEYYLS